MSFAIVAILCFASPKARAAISVSCGPYCQATFSAEPGQGEVNLPPGSKLRFSGLSKCNMGIFDVFVENTSARLGEVVALNGDVKFKVTIVRRKKNQPSKLKTLRYAIVNDDAVRESFDLDYFRMGLGGTVCHIEKGLTPDLMSAQAEQSP